MQEIEPSPLYAFSNLGAWEIQMAGNDWVLRRLVVFQEFVKGLHEFLIGLIRPSHGT